MQMLGGLFPFAQMLQRGGGGRGQRFQHVLEQLGADSPPHVQMVRPSRWELAGELLTHAAC